MSLPATGEQVTFESGDAPNITSQTIVRVHRTEVQPQDFGIVSVYGWRIGYHGMPETAEELFRVSGATLEARRVTRRIRH